jgi:signal transduction histidine kinase
MEVVVSRTLLARTQELRVLFVEDSSVLRHASTKTLQDYFTTIDTACDGQEGLDLFINFRRVHQAFYDIVITDLEMPNMDGYELTKRILQANPQQEIIITSSHKDVSGLIELINLGITKFLTKPIASDLLHEMIVHVADIIHHKQLEREELDELEQYNQILKEREAIHLQQLEKNLVELEISNKALQAANAAKDDFFRNISHEMRTPLNAILGLTSLLARRHYKDEKLASSLSIIDDSARNLHQLIESVLDVQNIQNGTLVLQVKEFELSPLFNECIHLCDKRSQKYTVTFNAHLDATLPMTFVGDRERIKKILKELLDNAFKFTPKGGDVDLYASYDDAKLHIQIVDTGIGISADDQKTIFQISQIDTSLTRAYEGAGLGLSVVKALVERMNGILTLHSGVGRGTTFLIELPQSQP